MISRRRFRLSRGRRLDFNSIALVSLNRNPILGSYAKMRFSGRNERAELPSLKNLFVKLNGDLFKIANRKPSVCWDAEQLNQLEIMILILEDRRFFNHLGFDMVSISREIWKAMTFRRYGGASTIDMQLVRTLTDYRASTVRRKLYEIILSIIIQFHYSKLEILRSYLDCAYFGHGLRGVDVASSRIYGVAAEHLTFEQAAELAAMLVYPYPKSPTAEWQTRVRRRALYAIKLFPILKSKIS
jgi:membrane carboxypeptidase/penicillin-binding protein